MLLAFAPRRTLGVALAALTLAFAVAPALAVTPPTFPTAAVRLDGGAIPGRIIDALWDEDDDTETIALPADLALNFFGTRYAALCVTTNGGVYPVAEAGDSCSDDYDYSVGDLALSSNAPMIAVLALDLDLSENVILSDGRDSNDLEGSITSVVAGAGLSTVTTSSSHNLVTGDHVVLFDTGDIALERTDGTMRNHEVIVTGATTFTVAHQVGATVSTGSWAFSDGRGAPTGIYWHETTIDDETAVLITWYRVANNDDDNDESLSNSLQMVLRSRGTGDAGTTGVDFDIEYNFGSLLDDEDGYLGSQPDSDCTAYDSGAPGSEYEDCRWGMGWADYTSGDVASVVVTGGVATVTITSPHGFPLDAAVSRSGVRLDIGPELVFARVPSASSFTFETTLETADFAATTTFEAADVYELFSETPISQLIDGGAKALVANRLNSAVDGRYVFGMAGGITDGFQPPFSVPTSDDGPTPTTSSSSWIPVDGSTPTLPVGTGLWQLEDGTGAPLTQSSPGTNQVRYSGDGIRVTFTGAAGTSTARGLVADQRGEVECEICAFLAAGGVIEAWMFSEPRLVAAFRIEDLPCQRFRIPVGSPLDGGAAIEAGSHTLQLVLPTASGLQAVNVGVTVGGGLAPTAVRAGDGGTPGVVLRSLAPLAAVGLAPLLLRRRRPSAA